MNHSAAYIDALRSLRLFMGAATPAECRVYAEMDRSQLDPAGGEWTLSGHVTGPFCPYAQTLSASHALVDRGPGNTLLAESRVSEACFWTPEFPYLYDVELELLLDGVPLGHTRRLFGMRWFAAEGRTLLCERQPWILAALRTKRLIVDDLNAMHESGIAAVLAAPDDATCVAASRIGVLLVADLALSGEQLEHELKRLAQWPAVGFCILPVGVEVSSEARRSAGNILLVQNSQIEAFERGEVEVAPWAHAVMLGSQKNSPLPWRKLSRDVPHFVTFPAPVLDSIAGFRQGINIWRDRWMTQASDTPEVLPAGYILDRPVVQ